MRRLLFTLALVLWAASAQAIDRGIASGGYSGDEVEIAFTHSVALRRDDLDRAIDEGRSMRVLLSDVELPAAVLHGGAFPPVRAMARAGEVRGLLLEFDPADRNNMLVTVLAKPAEDGMSLTTITLSDTTGLWKRLEVAPTRILGDLDRDGSMKLSFSAPVFIDPVTADLKGAAAQAGLYARVLIDRAKALGRGDMVAAAKLTSRQTSAQLAKVPPEYLAAIRAEVPAMLRDYARISRVIVRSDNAAVILPNGDRIGLIMEDGVWKAE